METTTLPDIDERIRAAKERREHLWQEFKRIEEETKPILDQVQEAREAWYTAKQRVDVLETIKAEGIQ